MVGAACLLRVTSRRLAAPQGLIWSSQMVSGGAIKHAIGLPVAGVNSGLLIRGQSKVIK
jgi:hypothetical protein